jgi:hypothetical protein
MVQHPKGCICYICLASKTNSDFLSDYQDTVLEEALKHWGIDFYLDQLQEEAAELIVAVNHYRRRRKRSEEKLIFELAHVHLMTEIVKKGLKIHKTYWESIKLNEVERIKTKVVRNDINATNDEG